MPKPKKILIVDDEKDLVDTLTFRLEANNFTVTSANDGKSGLDKAVSERPDLILLDVMMPEMDGFETLRRLKNSPGTGKIPVIMITCRHESESILRAEDLGATDYIFKPVDTKELLDLIAKHT